MDSVYFTAVLEPRLH